MAIFHHNFGKNIDAFSSNKCYSFHIVQALCINYVKILFLLYNYMVKTVLIVHCARYENVNVQFYMNFHKLEIM